MPRQTAPVKAKPRRTATKTTQRANRAQIDTASKPEISVGSRLRELRNDQKLSIRALAERSGLNVNTFSLIENGKTSPSVSTLQQIAAALEVPITAFFENHVPKSSIAHITARNRPHLSFAHGTLEDLGAGLSSRAVEPFVVTLEPHAGSGDTPIVHTGFEFVFCLQGCLTYRVEDQSYVLEPGDSLLFESYLPHQWQNDEAQPAQAILVLYPTDTRDHPTERHFAAKES
jgi:transcriptional regulator with XRE-family HTH domain